MLRNCYSAGSARRDFRKLCAGRFVDSAALRRLGPRAVDFERADPLDGRAVAGLQPARAGLAVLLFDKPGETKGCRRASAYAPEPAARARVRFPDRDTRD